MIIVLINIATFIKKATQTIDDGLECSRKVIFYE